MTVESSLDAPICSAKRCTAVAVWALRWNNPKIHESGRRKTWVACDAHREHLAEFLGSRDFLCAVEPLEDGSDQAES
jgi:hypothetical protein